MSDAAVVLICDQGYLIPTLSSALSARANISDPNVPIWIFILGEEPTWADRLRFTLSSHGILLKWTIIDDLKALATYHRDRYLPPVTLARFWLDDLLPPEVKRLLYIDGDVMVDDSLDALLAFVPPADQLVVAPDNLQLFLDEHGVSIRADRDYIEKLGVALPRYFNAGVLYTTRTGWKQIVSEAVDFLKSHPDRCRSSDQSALNHSASGRTLLLSQRYNYQSEHMMVLPPEQAPLRIAIYHFTGGPKPWTAPEWPWSPRFNLYFQQAERIGEPFGLKLGPAPEAQSAAGRAHRRRFRIRQTWVYPWRRLSRRRKLLKLLLRPEVAL